MIRAAQKRYFSSITISKSENQALELAKYARHFMDKGKPAQNVGLGDAGAGPHEDVPH